MYLDNKTILITGGGGSFGTKFVEVILREHNPKSVRVYDQNELREVEMEREMDDSRLRFFIGNTRDKERLKRAMAGVDIVVHAAALKHVSKCEYDPIEAVKTNIQGAINVIDAALDNNVDKIMNISTDKAVYPVNLYGATKMVAEKLFTQGNAYASKNGIFSSCRYGNVVGSSGSVIPLFLKQKKLGELTITDERMTRFWITLEQGVKFVINSIEKMQGGEVFVPKISSMKISDLAETIAPGIPRKIIGIKPGEKINEVLLTAEEAKHSKEYKDFFIIEPEFKFWQNKQENDGNSLPEGFEFRSDTNENWISPEQMKEMLASLT